MLRYDSLLAERLHRLDSRHNPEAAVKHSRVSYGIDMRADRELSLRPAAIRPDQIADRIGVYL